ncbi:TIGR04283 family arsenosugar biosynthesis glycosyltransferase [Aequorivita sp. SDUM287046]|uniref:TIGR04283 family arsenosugar biosynthesis glycosyltransferase n=1 Tax=Aequorivita aurantiaca TaxID=3053356 RepID=A0ABT8DJ54_9FLAO|nr:TIGR04283 family arsenosugar biosynthesis glycosyltransferase [Aequorivita aurantiaca]MDN3724829.1 TIGR04283 family arsenosugar biosynthesis glycosyltransferase [Aequorivita aurantiaca]
MLSIIIPVLNEAENIGRLIHYLSENLSGTHKTELIVVDGGSTDGSQNSVASFKPRNFLTSISLIQSDKGRAKQMNAGARKASGEILYFLHADSFPPKNFDFFIISEVNKGNPAGCFRMKFDSNHWWLRLAGWLTQFTWRACRGGDQSQFITKNLFEEIGGFDEDYAIYEDNILINELYSRKKFVVIQQCLITSARLYRQNGIWNLQYHFWTIYIKRWLGADAESLKKYYSKHIKTSPQS